MLFPASPEGEKQKNTRNELKDFVGAMGRFVHRCRFEKEPKFGPPVRVLFYFVKMPEPSTLYVIPAKAGIHREVEAKPRSGFPPSRE